MMLCAWLTPKALCSLHVLEFAQLQRLGTQKQAAQAGPAGQAEHGAQQEELQVGALGAGLEQLGMLVEEDLHHQRAGGDQQHVGHRGQHGVEVLDHLVDPAAEVARQDAQAHCQRQGGHGREGADDEGRADALERLVQHVVAGQVGAEHVVVAHPAETTGPNSSPNGTQESPQQATRQGICAFAAPGSSPPLPKACQPAARSCRGDPSQHRRRQRRGHEPRPEQHDPRPLSTGHDRVTHCVLGVLSGACTPCLRRGATRVHLSIDLPPTPW
jgi:hypothetical protein